MAITRSDLRDKIRDKLSDWWVDQDQLNGSINSSVTSATVDDGSKFHEGDIIEIESEALKVTNVSTNTLTIIRGYAGTTAATHADDSVVYVVNEWRTNEINDAVASAFRGLFPLVSVPYIGNIRGHKNRFRIDDCDTANWTEGGDAAADTLNTSDYKEGTASLNLGATYSTGSATYTKTITATQDFTEVNYINIWVYVAAKQDSSNDYYYDPNQFCVVRVGNDASNYGSISVRLDEVREGGWTLLSLPVQDFTETGTWAKATTDYLYIDFKVLKDITSGDLKMDEWHATSYPVTTNKTRYRLPERVFRLNKVRVYQDTDAEVFYDEERWDVIDNYLVFRVEVDAPGWSTGVETAMRNKRFQPGFPMHKPIQLFGDRSPKVPTADSDTLDLDDRMEELVVLGATIYLYERLQAQRTRFRRYSAKLNKEDASVLDVIRSMNSYRQRYESLVSQFEDPGKPVMMDFGH